MRKPNPKKQPNAGRIAQNTHKLPAELIQLAVENLELPRYPAGHPNAGKRIGVSALEDVEARLNEFGAKLRPKIRVVRQPPNSPDTNICDLALFRALAVAVHKRRRTTSHTTLFDLERLVKDVEAAFKEYDADTLDSMWDYKTYVMEQIAIDGGNTYPRHRPQDRKRKRG